MGHHSMIVITSCINFRTGMHTWEYISLDVRTIMMVNEDWKGQSVSRMDAPMVMKNSRMPMPFTAINIQAMVR